MENLTYVFMATTVALIVQYFWRKWNRSCKECEPISDILKEIKDLKTDNTQIKKIVLKIATEMKLDVRAYEKLVE